MRGILRPSLLAWFAVLPCCAFAQADSNPPAPESWNVHGQATNVFQWHPAFTSPYEGGNSLDPGNNGRETTDITLFFGARLWQGAAAFVNPEVDQGFGLSDTLGVAGFTSGAAYKVGARNPYFRLPRAYLRQEIGADGGATEAVESGANQLGGTHPVEGIVITAGKFSVVDVFDTNRYAHDPRADFLNWAVIDAGAFDYAADAWGYTYGATLEWARSWWTLRSGLFALSKVPNSKDIDGTFDEFSIIAEAEERHQLRDLPGKLKLLAFLNRARMGKYDDAIALARSSDSAANTALVRQYNSRPGVALNLEQQLGANFGGFARASYNVGSQEAYEFSDINRSLSVGISLQGNGWQRADDALGVAAVVNALSEPARGYFAAGGMGILAGDGQLPNYAREKVLEMYYDAHFTSHFTVTGDFQLVDDPAYNRDRGPVSVFGLRLHGEF